MGSSVMASQAQVQAVEVYTTNEPCMMKAMEYKGLVLASKVKSRNVFSDIGAGFKSMVGGELKEKAANIGANAVVGLRMETNSVFEGMLDMVVWALRSSSPDNLYVSH